MGQPYASWNMRQKRSAAYFDTAYGDTGLTGPSSRNGAGASPYTSPLPTYTKRSNSPSSAFSRFTVPCTFVWMFSSIR